MKKHLSYIATWLLAALMFASCSDFEEFFTPEDKDCVTLTLTMGGENLMTRATQQIGDNTFNENTIDKIDIFLYPIGGTEQNAVYQKTITGINDDDSDGDKQHKVKTSIGSSDINALFPDGATECVAFVIVNRPNDVTFTDTDIESLKNLELTCTAFTTLQPINPSEEDGYKMVSIPDNFVMSGQNNVALNPQNRSITGEVEVYRSASKTTLEITNVVDKVQDENDATRWWHSNPDNIRIYFKNCKEKGHLNNIELDNWSDGKKTLKPIGMQEIAEQAGHYTSLTPLYSYATNWANNINNRASIIVVVPWAQGTEIAPTGKFTETYYEIPINDAEERLDRNTYYKLALEIGVVGSFQEEQPLEILNCSYIILPWGTEHSDVETSLAAVRYLVVDEKEVVMNNVISYRINFSSSHPVEIRQGSMVIKRRDLTQSNATWNDQPQSATNPGGLRIVNGVPDYFRVPISSDESGTYMMIEHDLVNNMDKNSDYSDYYMEFIIQHTDNEAYSQKITVTQHPMVYAEAELNTNNNVNIKTGMYVNGSQSGYESDYIDYYDNYTNFYGGMHGLGGSNVNPNRYIINATTLTTDNYIIGDPRLRQVNNLLEGDNITTESSAAAQWSQISQYNLYNNNKTRYNYYGNTSNNGNYYRLQFYHPTEESNRTVKMVSPQFMIASSYGVCQTGIPKENARKRCASYQEDSYPAGRWRLPTSAEVEYIVQLSSWGIIPPLFGSSSGNSYYWTANGVIRVNQSLSQAELYNGNVVELNTYYYNGAYVEEGNNYEGISVRCVYDTWYWTDKCTKTQFTWGDKQDTSYWGQ